MKHTSHIAIGVLGWLLVGCQTLRLVSTTTATPSVAPPVAVAGSALRPASPVPTAGPPASVAPSSFPTSSTEPAPATLVLTGRATLPSGPFAGAQLLVYAAATGETVGTAATAADGTFSVALKPANAGQLLHVVAFDQGTSLVSVTRVGQTRLLAVGEGLHLDLGTTLAYMALATSFDALGQLDPTPQQLQDALDSLEKLSVTALTAVAALAPDDVQTLLNTANIYGAGAVPTALAYRVTVSSQPFGDALNATAQTLGSLITARVQAGALLRGSYRGQGLVFGRVSTPNLFTSSQLSSMQSAAGTSIGGGGCDPCGPPASTDSSTDTGSSTSTGSSTDTGSSTSTGSSTDTGSSTSTGSSTDTGSSTSTGSSTDTGSSTSTGSSTDTGSNTGSTGSIF